MADSNDPKPTKPVRKTGQTPAKPVGNKPAPARKPSPLKSSSATPKPAQGKQTSGRPPAASRPPAAKPPVKKAVPEKPEADKKIVPPTQPQADIKNAQQPEKSDKKPVQRPGLSREREGFEKLSWKTFMLPLICVLLIIAFFVYDRVIKKQGKFPEPKDVVTAFILETKNLPVFINNKITVPDPKPDLTEFVTDSDKIWFNENYKKLAFIAVGKNIAAYNYLNDDEKRLIAMILLVKDCPTSSIKQELVNKKVYDTAEYSFTTSDNRTFDLRLKREGLNWKVEQWFGARYRWEQYMPQIANVELQ